MDRRRRVCRPRRPVPCELLPPHPQAQRRRKDGHSHTDLDGEGCRDDAVVAQGRREDGCQRESSVHLYVEVTIGSDVQCVTRRVRFRSFCAGSGSGASAQGGRNT